MPTISLKGGQKGLDEVYALLIVILLYWFDGSITLPSEVLGMVNGLGVRGKKHDDGTSTYWIVGPEERIEEMKRITGGSDGKPTN